MIKPFLASDYDESKLRFPLLAAPKIDGVRGLNTYGTLTGRSLKEHKNRYTTRVFSQQRLIGCDGELIAGENPRAADLCRKTSSAVGTIEGTPLVTWWLFDYFAPEVFDLPYSQRYLRLMDLIAEIGEADPALAALLRVVPTVLVHDLEELEEADTINISKGYEGTIIWDPNGKRKQGRSTPREGGYLRIKRFIDFEGEVVEVIEGEENLNEAKTNELGRTERSSHKENMIPNGMVGRLMVRALADVTWQGRVLFKKGDIVKVAPGKLTHQERRYYMREPNQIVGKIIKAQFFPHGFKDKPRFPTFQTFRSREDMS